jgi:hypothetical protein
MSDQGELFPEPGPDVRAEKTFLLSGKVWVSLSADDVKWAEDLAALRQGRAEVQHRPNLRVVQRPDLELHRLGAFGEVVMARHYDLPLPALDLGASSGDVGGVEIKTTLKRRGWAPVLYLWRKKHDDDPERPVLLICDEGARFELVGWLWSHEVRVPEFWNEALPRPCWAVPAARLRSPKSLPVTR